MFGFRLGISVFQSLILGQGMTFVFTVFTIVGYFVTYSAHCLCIIALNLDETDSSTAIKECVSKREL